VPVEERVAVITLVGVIVGEAVAVGVLLFIPCGF
jgi:hypothetical protein